ncbi:HPr family phosphocarrier protein [Streptomyces sp. NPDC049881]|uniref:HPr family phosphocarrier protein n=1 Tax=unclassified Streptomyces TaxID=2593676 RepID=UPI00343EAFA6
MIERRVTIGWADGLHARPASVFVRAAMATGVPVTIARPGGAAVNAASLLAVLTLGAQGGDEVVLASSAEDTPAAREAVDRLARLVSEGLEELPEKA